MAIFKVDEYTDIIGPSIRMLGPIKSGDSISTLVPPGCWGPMITPNIKSGHEVSLPVAIEDAHPGDAVAIIVKEIKMESRYTSSGNSIPINQRFGHDPTVDAICPNCKTKNPNTYVSGIGEESIRCSVCDETVLPQKIGNGYTLIFNDEKTIGISVPKQTAENIANNISDDQPLPKNSKQHHVNILAKSDIQNLITRVHLMIGNIGLIPNKNIPSSRNAGDTLASLTRLPEFYDVDKTDLTDAHMDINTVTEKSIIIAPVKVKGGGLYIGDVHSVQGNGELAGHTADVTACVTVEIHLIKNLPLDGPIIIPTAQNLNPIFQPISVDEYKKSEELAKEYGFALSEKSYPVQFVGSGNTLNEAIDNAIERAEQATNLTASELRNRATVTGSVDIGRTSGVVYISMMLPESILRKMKIEQYVLNQYKTNNT
ncbi:acetamidase/formamidase family protein [Bacillus sp. JJ1532]|uniref:acetamidase/formamidase family protein n=1 Tax=Bacillus sp. JJ1532 TaxID=3122958 RepID=UPI003000B412